MDTIELKALGGVFRDVHRGAVGVYTRKDGTTYAGERKGAVSHGYAVVTWSGGKNVLRTVHRRPLPRPP